MGETRETLEPQDQRGQGPFVYQVSKLQARECETEANGLAGIHGEVIIQHIMQMIDTDIFWYVETFKEVLTALRKIALGETTIYTDEKLDENGHFESAMMCWESLDESEPTSKRRKTLAQEEATNDQVDELDDDPHNQRTTNKGVGSLIPINDLQLGADDDASTLATQETLAKNLVYVTNIPDGKLDYTKNARDSSKNSDEQDRKPSSLLKNPTN